MSYNFFRSGGKNRIAILLFPSGAHIFQPHLFLIHQFPNGLPLACAQSHAVLETLDPADREMIHAVFFDGLSMREYAKRLGVYPRAVVYRMERLLKMLRKML